MQHKTNEAGVSSTRAATLTAPPARALFTTAPRTVGGTLALAFGAAVSTLAEAHKRQDTSDHRPRTLALRFVGRFGLLALALALLPPEPVDGADGVA